MEAAGREAELDAHVLYAQAPHIGLPDEDLGVVDAVSLDREGVLVDRPEHPEAGLLQPQGEAAAAAEQVDRFLKSAPSDAVAGRVRPLEAGPLRHRAPPLRSGAMAARAEALQPA